MSAPSDGARGDARKRLAAEAAGSVSALTAEIGTIMRRYSMPRGIAINILASDWLAGVIADAKAEAWDERDRARATYPHPHPDDCMGWEDCDCASYPNPYRAATS